ncbi:MAG: TonB-dependent receptor, partial [Alistipes sp.]|nr:TonB-dependent receptor [Alistipes sp.]
SLAPKFFDKHLTVSLSAKGVYSHQRYADGGAVGNAAFFDPTQDYHFRNEDGSVDWTMCNGWWNYGAGTSDNYAPNTLARESPLSLLYDKNNKADVFRFLGNAQIDYKVHGLEALRFNLNLGMDWSKSDTHNGVNPGSLQAWKDSRRRGIGQYNEGMDLRRNHVLDFYANYNETWGMHRLDAMAGYSWQHFYSANQNFSYFNEMRCPDCGAITNKNELNPENPGLFYQEESYLVSFYTRLNYTLNEKYLFTFTLRADGSSKFSEDNRWGYFPSAAFAWNILNENFMKDQDVVSNLKLRLGYGQTGQQEIGNYRHLARYGLSSAQDNMANMGSAGYQYFWTPYAYDPNITWETTTTYNIGVDFGFLDGRIGGSIDVYRRDTEDLLNSVTTPLGANFGTTLLTNIGEMRNTGVEFSLDFTPVRTEDWNLRIGFNGTYQNTEFVKLNNTNDPNYMVKDGKSSKGTGGASLTAHTVGYKPYTYYTFQQLYDANGHPIQNAFVDRNKNGQIDQGDRYLTGKSPLPDFFYGVNLKLSYKNWDFGFNGHGSIGNYAFNNCQVLENIVIPDKCTSIGTNAFNNCKALASISIGSGVAQIGNSAFNECSALVDVNIKSLSSWCKIKFDSTSANPLYYGGDLLLNESKVTSLTIPSDVTEVLTYSFYNYADLTDVTFHNKVTAIGSSSFYNTLALATITFKGATPPTVANDAFGTGDTAREADPVIYVPNGSYADYLNSDWPKNYKQWISANGDELEEGFTIE